MIWSLHDKYIVVRKSRNVPVLFQFEGSLQHPNNVSCSEAEQSNPHRHNLFP
jgi:hypothetical protein